MELVGCNSIKTLMESQCNLWIFQAGGAAAGNARLDSKSVCHRTYSRQKPHKLLLVAGADEARDLPAARILAVLNLIGRSAPMCWRRPSPYDGSPLISAFAEAN
jgi:hypothetical protein